jgi:glycosyltransferase involved in cell wall biosynthesis
LKGFGKKSVQEYNAEEIWGPLMHMSNGVEESQVYLSVVIRTRNEAKSLRQVLQALEAQRCNFKWETIIVDNESEDETLELCKQYKVRVVPIQRDEWTPGRALNLGISLARGELIFLCSAHCVPVGSYFFENAVLPFSDPEMAAVRCLSGSNKDEMSEWYTARDIQYRSLEEQGAAESGTEWISRYPTAACCVIRRSVWERIRYNEDFEGLEDKLWASQVLREGFKIRCRAEAVYIYTRERGMRATWEYHNRAFKDLYRATGYVPLSWPRFLFRVLRAGVLAPLVAMRYFFQTVMSQAYLVIIPWQVKLGPRRGSKAEYDIPAFSWPLSKLLDKTIRRP